MNTKLKKVLINLLDFPKRLFNNISFTAIIFNSNIDKLAAISGNSRVYNSKIEKYSYMGRNNFVDNTSIGKFTSIADNCFIGVASHPMNWVSMSPVFCSGKNILKKNLGNLKYEDNKHTVIGNDVWIGCNVLIKAGVSVGDGAVIGMGSVVTKDVEPYSIVGGVPAETIKYRFDKETIESLEKIKWWNLSQKELEKIAEKVKVPKEFIDLIEKERKA